MMKDFFEDDKDEEEPESKKEFIHSMSYFLPIQNRKNNMLIAFNFCQKKTPMEYRELSSLIALETGLSILKIKEYLKILFDAKKITIDNNDIVRMVE